MGLAVPLSRFTSRVGGGSAFYVSDTLHMFHKLASPFVIAGLMLMVFGGLLLLEAVFCSIVIEAILALGISVAGWFVRRAGIAKHITLRTWFRLLTLGLPTLLILYVAGYFVLMDRSRPTFWSMSARPHYFDSSLRMVPNEWGDFAHTFRAGNSLQVTILNLVFRPADKVYFWLYPRSEEEQDRIRRPGL